MELFTQETPPIVLTDIKMPGLDGMEVLKRIKALSPDTEVIMITGHGEMELAIKSLQLEASDFITKPIHEEALSVALRRAEEKLAWKRLIAGYNEELKDKVQEATAELKKNYALQEKLLQSSLDAIIGTDREGRVILFNNSAQTLSGYTLQEIRDPASFLARLIPDWGAFITQALQKENARGQPLSDQGRPALRQKRRTPSGDDFRHPVDRGPYQLVGTVCTFRTSGRSTGCKGNCSVRNVWPPPDRPWPVWPMPLRISWAASREAALWSTRALS